MFSADSTGSIHMWHCYINSQGKKKKSATEGTRLWSTSTEAHARRSPHAPKLTRAEAHTLRSTHAPKRTPAEAHRRRSAHPPKHTRAEAHTEHARRKLIHAPKLIQAPKLTSAEAHTRRSAHSPSARAQKAHTRPSAYTRWSSHAPKRTRAEAHTRPSAYTRGKKCRMSVWQQLVWRDDDCCFRQKDMDDWISLLRFVCLWFLLMFRRLWLDVGEKHRWRWTPGMRYAADSVRPHTTLWCQLGVEGITLPLKVFKFPYQLLLINVLCKGTARWGGTRGVGGVFWTPPAQVVVLSELAPDTAEIFRRARDWPASVLRLLAVTQGHVINSVVLHPSGLKLLAHVRNSVLYMVDLRRWGRVLTCDQALLFLLVREGLDKLLSSPSRTRRKKKGLVAGGAVWLAPLGPQAQPGSARLSQAKPGSARLRQIPALDLWGHVSYWWRRWVVGRRRSIVDLSRPTHGRRLTDFPPSVGHFSHPAFPIQPVGRALVDCRTILTDARPTLDRLSTDRRSCLSPSLSNTASRSSVIAPIGFDRLSVEIFLPMIVEVSVDRRPANTWPTAYRFHLYDRWSDFWASALDRLKRREFRTFLPAQNSTVSKTAQCGRSHIEKRTGRNVSTWPGIRLIRLRTTGPCNQAMNTEGVVHTARERWSAVWFHSLLSSTVSRSWSVTWGRRTSRSTSTARWAHAARLSSPARRTGARTSGTRKPVS